MFITKKHLSRRTLLRGGTAAIGLPLLSAMVPAATALAQTAAAPKPRMGFFYLPHGAIMNNTRFGAEMNRWTPDAVGRNFDLKPILEPFKPLQEYLTVVSGLGNKPAESSAVHAIVPATWLSAEHPRQSHSPFGGVTIDQIAARHIGQDTPLPSLEVATEEEGGGAACDGTYGCSYGRTISFRTPTTPLPMEFEPRRVFEKIFGRGKSDAERRAVSGDYQSLLDMVLAEANALKATLGGEDRVLVDDYLDSVREIERRLTLLGQRDLTKIDLPDVPVARPSFDELIRLQFDLIVAAFQANMTRIASFMMAAEVSNQSYAHVGVPDAFHPVSHHADNKASMEKLVLIQRYHTQVFADFMTKLSKISDGDAGSILDNSIFLYGSNMSNSNQHNQFPLPTLVSGGGAGAIAGNQHLVYPDRTPLANLLFTLLLRVGVPVDKVGDSTGELAEV
ncbi:MAG TPA: DUF1552 domain-containing protein [Gammaproteobacteria bacterium]|nr:DUF1552 domain-containing protein [Gammaproteobacteria bacterium]